MGKKQIELENRVRETFEEMLSAALAKLKGKATHVGIGSAVLASVIKKFSDADLVYRALTLPLVIRAVKRKVDQGCIEKAAHDQGELFPVEMLDAFVKPDAASFIPFGYATKDVVDLVRIRKQENAARAQASSQRFETRYQVLLDLGMRDNPKMTVRQAVAIHNKATEKTK